jgi:hypothetical protein
MESKKSSNIEIKTGDSIIIQPTLLLIETPHLVLKVIPYAGVIYWIATKIITAKIDIPARK